VAGCKITCSEKWYPAVPVQQLLERRSLLDVQRRHPFGRPDFVPHDGTHVHAVAAQVGLKDTNFGTGFSHFIGARVETRRAFIKRDGLHWISQRVQPPHHAELVHLNGDLPAALRRVGVHRDVALQVAIRKVNFETGFFRLI
jgi:hypothetical protein